MTFFSYSDENYSANFIAKEKLNNFYLFLNICFWHNLSSAHYPSMQDKYWCNEINFHNFFTATAKTITIKSLVRPLKVIWRENCQTNLVNGRLYIFVRSLWRWQHCKMANKTYNNVKKQREIFRHFILSYIYIFNIKLVFKLSVVMRA